MRQIAAMAMTLVCLIYIIREAIGAYFEKDKDAAAAAGIIQNHVSIYISECME